MEVVGDDVGDGVGVAGSIDVDYWDTQAAGAADGVFGDEPVSGKPIALCSGWVADAGVDTRGSG